MATELYRRKINPSIIAKLLGNSVDMIEDTYSHMIIDDVIDALEQHPLIRKYSTPESIMKSLIEMVKSYGLHSDKRFEFEIDIKNDEVFIHSKIKR